MNSQSPGSSQPRPSLEFLRNVSLFKGLTDDALNEIACLMKFRAFGSGMTLFHEDMPGMTLYLVAEGYVRTYSIGHSGQEFTYSIFGPFEIFGELSLLDNGYHDATCMTLTPIKTWILSREHLFEILNKYPLVTFQLLRLAANRVRSAARKSEAMAFQDVQGRLAFEMINLAAQNSTRTEEGALINVPLSQVELASMVGATRESVNKALTMFRSQNLIKLTGFYIVIIDREGLERILLERGR